jgi:SAM-dependent methyltransferase
VSAQDVDAGSREHYVDAALYDYEYRRRREDIRFYRHLAAELLGGPGRILELACGSGRLTVGLLRDGHQVVGLDAAPAMLARAAARIGALGRGARARAALIRGDIRRFALGERFPLVLMGFNSFEHLYTRGDVAACLARVAEHLTADGRFVFDVQNPDLRWLSRDPRRRWARTPFRHPGTGERLVYSTDHHYDPVSQIVVVRLYYQPEGGETRVIRLSQRKFFPAELEALLAGCGYRVESRFGDFEGEPLHGGAASQVVVCRPR